jgi:hypothetical protein
MSRDLIVTLVVVGLLAFYLFVVPRLGVPT